MAPACQTAPMPTSCPVCGFDPSSVSPADAIVALRSLPRRFRELTDPSPTDDDRDDREHGDAVRSRARALAEAGVVGGIISALSGDLHRVLVSDDPAITTTDDTATAPGFGGDPATSLQRLSEATAEAAAQAEGQPAEAWARQGTRADGPVSALDLLREAVHAGVHRLRETTSGTSG